MSTSVAEEEEESAEAKEARRQAKGKFRARTPSATPEVGNCRDSDASDHFDFERWVAEDAAAWAVLGDNVDESNTTPSGEPGPSSTRDQVASKAPTTLPAADHELPRHDDATLQRLQASASLLAQALARGGAEGAGPDRECADNNLGGEPASALGLRDTTPHASETTITLPGRSPFARSGAPSPTSSRPTPLPSPKPEDTAADTLCVASPPSPSPVPPSSMGIKICPPPRLRRSARHCPPRE
ncbi:hypothetical protein BD626DRAFT_481667 [Schizophyllum amplum]|uniref:Uncharacterized protein n=1 Tax=Schizophyllum amplum TaxID=97359 RepID=A0A550CUF7_9AGAR|nr:hypothetical protein BD626DRAFT_481667 [Auriculariopsis ampla]